MRYILVFIPVLMAMSLALRDQYYRKDLTGSVLLSITSIIVMVRFCVLAYFFDGGEPSTLLYVMEQVTSMYAVPCTYMFLCDQCGTRWNNRESMIMLCLPVMSLLQFVPSLGDVAFRNWIVIVQCIIIAFCMLRLYQRIREYGILFTRQLKVYYTWMAFLLVFTSISFAIHMDSTTQDGGKWLYFIIFTLIISVGYLIIPYSFHIQPRPAAASAEVNPQQQQVEHVQQQPEEDNSGKLNQQLAEGLHKMMEEGLYFLRSEISIDDVAQNLGTNRTYVTRLMRQEYGLTFIEYVNVARIQYSQSLMYTSPSITLEEVAMKSGFQSTSNYCRAFKRYTGTTPKGWLQDASN